MIEAALRPRALALVQRAGGPDGARLAPLPGGANNRVWRVEGHGTPLLLKAYFRDEQDPRDRLATEFGFLRYAWDAGIRSVPEPLARDDEAGLGLYEYVEGDAFLAGDIVAADVEQAARFVEDLNAPAARARGGALPIASEACFSLAEHVDRVSARVDRLRAIAVSDEVDEDCARFVAEHLLPVWEDLRAETTRRGDEAPLRLDEVLPPAGRVVSPSDFGFHNALRSRDGIRFLDFEYAGWDDPAKLVCDFFCQPEVPVGEEHLARMIAAAGASEARVRLLLPVFRVKWCCILLNDFLDPGRARRRFALGEPAALERRARQLEQARRLTARVRVSA